MEDVRSVPGTGNRKLAAVAAGHHTLAAGPVVVITPSVGMNDPRAIRIITPGYFQLLDKNQMELRRGIAGN